MPIATCPMPPITGLCARRPFRRAQSPREPADADRWQSDQIVLGTFFNGGLRAYDISNPYQPKEVGMFVPPAPRVRRPAPSRSTTCSSTSARSSTPSIATSAGSTFWKWIFDQAAYSTVMLREGGASSMH